MIYLFNRYSDGGYCVAAKIARVLYDFSTHTHMAHQPVAMNGPGTSVNW